MQASKIFRKKIDFTFLAPAVLCNVGFLVGTIPPLLCLNANLFAYVSLGIFLFSLLVHAYILYQWKRYQDTSPVGYAIVQPTLHMIVLAYSLAVGAADFCAVSPGKPTLSPTQVELLPPPPISEA